MARFGGRTAGCADCGRLFLLTELVGYLGCTPYAALTRSAVLGRAELNSYGLEIAGAACTRRLLCTWISLAPGLEFSRSTSVVQEAEPDP